LCVEKTIYYSDIIHNNGYTDKKVTLRKLFIHSYNPVHYFKVNAYGRKSNTIFASNMSHI